METSAQSDEVNFVSGRTRLLGIVGHPIEQVRSPEMFTAELMRRGHHALMIPIHVYPADFNRCLPQLKRIQNLDGLVFTIPFKQAACELADEVGTQARVVGAINALARLPDGRWRGDIFDGLGCVEGFRRRGFSFANKRVALIGAGGAGTAIGVAIAHESPHLMHIYDPDPARLANLRTGIGRANAKIAIADGVPDLTTIDILLNASPIGMLDDSRMPINVDRLPKDLIVFDAIVKPETTKLLALAEACGCRTVRGREMMHGQISRMVDFFGFQPA